MDEHQDELEVMLDKVSELYSTTQYMTTLRLAEEAHRKARNEKELIHLLNANFYIMNSANSSMHYKRAVEACLETIPLLESEEEASKLQPDFEPNQYHQYQWWLSACTYDNLATATAALQGNNADGLHQCIADGIAVCQRTGKTQCITCFREYATEVFLASDDLQMARKHAEINANRRSDESKERVWVSTRDLISMAMLEGDYAQVRRLFEKAPAEIGDYYNSEKAKSDCYTKLEEFKLMLGEFTNATQLTEQRIATPELRSTEENPRGKLELDKNDALLLTLDKSYQEALQILTPWDRELLEKGHLKDWFDVRLRVLAITFKTDPESKRFEKLSKQLLEKARTANDWLTVRRFQYLKSGETAWTPLALLGTPTEGLFKSADAQASDDDQHDQKTAETTVGPESPASTSEAKDLGQDSELAQALNAIQVRLIELVSEESEASEEFQKLWNEIQDLNTSNGPPPQVARLLYLADAIAWHVDAPWASFEWVKQKLAEFADDGRIHSVAASLGETLLGTFARQDGAEDIASQAVELPLGLDDNWIEDRHEFAIQSAPDSAGVFSRAGGYFFRQHNFDRAERYLARASRLDRTDAFAALKLAEIYNDSERPLDALNVLDLCIRDGCESSDVVWSALMTAKTLEKYEELITYADRFDQLVEGYIWSHYYAADALLHLDRPADALGKIDLLLKSDESEPLAGYSMQALALSKLERNEDASEAIHRCLQTSLQTSDQITRSGVSAAVSRLYAASQLLQDEGLLPQLIERYSPAGFLPEEYFETLASEDREAEEVQFFMVVVQQELDASWKESPNAFPFQLDWCEACQNYGVIATSSDQASELVLSYHQRLWPTKARVIAINDTDHVYHDSPRIVWQSQLYEPETE